MGQFYSPRTHLGQGGADLSDLELVVVVLVIGYVVELTKGLSRRLSRTLSGSHVGGESWVRYGHILAPISQTTQKAVQIAELATELHGTLANGLARPRMAQIGTQGLTTT
jgi:hypothetical protein